MQTVTAVTTQLCDSFNIRHILNNFPNVLSKMACMKPVGSHLLCSCSATDRHTDTVQSY